ncbi:MAG TPA: aspartate aminotransferase family protein [candidate division Zixibacteria bacterium]|nr:aspartate aminotransferase family protein [candidate division Zixibacteria bacterium]
MVTEEIEEEIKKYKRNHGKSLQLWEQAKMKIPGGVSHNIRDFHMNDFNLGPPFIERAFDSRLEDVDGNIYIDYWITHGAAILGHAHKNIIEAISNQLPKGNHHGMVNKQAIDLAERIIDATSSIEKLRFCTTGTEATMYASRLARAYTNKKKIAKIRGGWHGGNDTLFYFVKEVEKGDESKGMRTQEEAEILSFDYNDTEGAIRLINENKKTLAAVVMEPVLGAGGAIPPRKGFLETIREETEKNDILLIYDEIITGFRLSYHSAQGFFDVTPDITTMGKIIGGGAPIGVIGGQADILDQANLPAGGEVWIGGGTFSSNSISMVSGIATLDTLKQGGDSLYKNLNDTGEYIRKEINKILEKYNAPAMVTGVGSMISIHWFQEKQKEIFSGSEIKLNLDKKKVSQYQLLMFNRDILVRGGLGYLSIKHTQEQIEKTLNAIDETTKIVVENI